MNKTVEVTRRLFDLLAHLIVALDFEDIGYEVQGVLVIWVDLGIKSREVEAVRQVVFVHLPTWSQLGGTQEWRFFRSPDLRKVLITSGLNKLFDER